MYRFTTNPPCRSVKPQPAYIPTFFPLPDVGDPIASDGWMPTEQILAGFQRYFDRSGMAPSAIGRLLAGDSALFSDMRNGRQIGSRLQARLVRFLEDRADA